MCWSGLLKSPHENTFTQNYTVGVLHRQGYVMSDNHYNHLFSVTVMQRQLTHTIPHWSSTSVQREQTFDDQWTQWTLCDSQREYHCNKRLFYSHIIYSFSLKGIHFGLFHHMLLLTRMYSMQCNSTMNMRHWATRRAPEQLKCLLAFDSKWLTPVTGIRDPNHDGMLTSYFILNWLLFVFNNSGKC